MQAEPVSRQRSQNRVGETAAMATAKTVLLITATTTLAAANSVETGAAEAWTEAESVRRGGGHVEA